MSITAALTLQYASPLSNIPFILAADLITGGTVTISYPTGKSRGNFFSGVGHQLGYAGGTVALWGRDFELTFNAASCVLTWRAAGTVPAGTTMRLSLEENGPGPQFRDAFTRDLTGAVTGSGPGVVVSLGSPAAALATIILSASVPANRVAGTGDYSMSVNVGAAVTNLVANLNLDCPGGRPIVMVSSNVGDTTQVMTAFGFDCYGQAMRETRTLNGTTTVTFLKCFARITRINSATVLVGNLSVGTNAILGIPVFIVGTGANAAFVVKELLDGALATAGVFVSGVVLVATATSGDVRGTYAPNSVPDGSRNIQLLMVTPDPGYTGGPQFNG